MNSKLILVIDDEVMIARLVQVNLERAGYTVRIAHDGREALEILPSLPAPPDLIILDVTMPYMDGFEMLSHLKADPALAHIPVVMLTARSRDADFQAGYERGALHYILKPVNPTELLEVVNQVIQGNNHPLR